MTNRKLRVLYVFGAISDGGVEHIASDLVKNMDPEVVTVSAVYHSCDIKEGIQAIPCLYELWPNMEKAPNFNTLNCVQYRHWWKSFIASHEKYDIVHLHYVDSAFCYLDLFKKVGTITICHSHNPHAKPFTLGLLWSMIISYPARYICDYAFGCSHQAAEEIFGRKMLESGRCQVLFNGIYLDKFKYNKEKRNLIRREEGISDDKVIIGHVGRFEYQKNHSFLIDIFNYYHNKINNNSELWLIGTGSLLGQIQEKVKTLGLTDHVRFFGNISNVSDYLQAFDCFLMPSNYEGLSLAIVEAQVSGLPCVVSDAIQFDSDIKAGLLHVLSLKKSSIKDWSLMIDNVVKKERSDCTTYAKEAGFDIKEVAKQLQKLYCDVCLRFSN